MNIIRHKEIIYNIIGAAMDVHRELGGGLLVVDDVIVELKSEKENVPAHREQLFNYLRLSHMPMGLLINFGQASLQGERYAYFKEDNECALVDRDMHIVY